MFYSLKGILTEIGSNFVVIECSGVGYKCLSSAITQNSISEKVGAEVKLFTYMNVRQDAIDLFGFWSLDELNAFKSLTSVSGVGSKAGLAVLSVFPTEQLLNIISLSDTVSLTSVPGIGAKTAQRIVLELKGKLSFSGTPASNSLKAHVSSIVGNNIIEASKALSELGFNQNDVMPILSNQNPNTPVEQLIRIVLKDKNK